MLLHVIRISFLLKFEYYSIICADTFCSCIHVLVGTWVAVTIVVSAAGHISM